MYFLFLLQENIILKQKKNSHNNFSWGLTSNKEALFLDTLTAHTVLHMIESGDVSG